MIDQQAGAYGTAQSEVIGLMRQRAMLRREHETIETELAKITERHASLITLLEGVYRAHYEQPTAKTARQSTVLSRAIAVTLAEQRQMIEAKLALEQRVAEIYIRGAAATSAAHTERQELDKTLFGTS